MRIAILGTGVVGSTIGDKLVSIGHEVRMGSRSASNEKARDWAAAAGRLASQGTFADAAAFGEVAFNCTAGVSSLAALESVGAENLARKILLDVSNPLDFSKGMPPTLTICNTDSLGEAIQRRFPDTRVVKTLGSMNCKVMVEPSRIAGDHDVFVAGNDPEARAQVSRWLQEWFGWKAPVDLGDITAARGLEMWLPLWVRLMGTLHTADFNLKLAR
jgi:8-hydroxy-5-deazaflavin:NADPH oxidoreductase